jgi:homoserine O-acetyltransferase
MTSVTTLPKGCGLLHLPPLALEHGGVLRDAVLGFALHGPAAGPVVLAQGGISGDRDVPRWWSGLVGDGRALDTARVRVLGVDWLGGAGTSSGPHQREGGAFPAVTSRDQARATALLLEHLGVDRIDVVGASYGAMVGLALAEVAPEHVRRVVAISGAHEADPLATAWRSVQRRVVALGLERGCAREAVVLARALAMTTYRSREEFAARFAGVPREVDGALRFPVEDYLLARGADWAERFDPRAFVLLSQAIDLHRVDPANVRAAVTLVAVRQDQLVPLAQLQALARALGARARLVELDSPYGHDAFLKEHDALGAIVREALA